MADVWDEDRARGRGFDEGAPGAPDRDGGAGGCAPMGPGPTGPGPVPCGPDGLDPAGCGPTGFAPQDGPCEQDELHRAPQPQPPRSARPEPPRGPQHPRDSRPEPPRGVWPEPPRGPQPPCGAWPEPPRGPQLPHHGGLRPPRPASEPMLYLDCQAGIAGDMLVAALLDLGGDEEALRAALTSLPVDGYEVKVARVKKAGIDCCDFDVMLDAAHDGRDHDMAYLHGCGEGDKGGATNAAVVDAGAPTEGAAGHGRDPEGHASAEHTHGHRKLADIEAIIEAADLTDGARALALRTFRILAEAEAAAHAVPVDEVHFHEVGAVDSIVDIVAAAVLIDELGIRRVVVPVLVDGHGTIRCQHGVIPVPVPATLNICIAHSLPLSQADVEGELVTPTGAALVAALEPQTMLPARYVVEACGLGAGKREYARPSVLRAMVIRPLEPPMGGPGPGDPGGLRPEGPWGPRPEGPHEPWAPHEPWRPDEPWEPRGPRPHGHGGPQGPCGSQGHRGPCGPDDPYGSDDFRGLQGPCDYGDFHGRGHHGPHGPAPHGACEPWGPYGSWDARPPRPEPPCVPEPPRCGGRPQPPREGGHPQPPRHEPPQGNDSLEVPCPEPPRPEPLRPEPPCPKPPQGSFAPAPPCDPADRRVCKLECDIDDDTPEQLAYAAERLRAAGAREVHWIPVFTKKGRPAYQLQVICAERDAAHLEGIIFTETTTIGIRRCLMERTVLPRSIEVVDTPWGPVRVKRVELPDGHARVTPEYEDCAAIAHRERLALSQVMEVARAAARCEP